MSSALYTGTLIHARRDAGRERLPLPRSRSSSSTSTSWTSSSRRCSSSRSTAAEPGHAARRRPLRRRRAPLQARRRSAFCAERGVERRARVDARAAARPRLRLQPGQLLLVLPGPTAQLACMVAELNNTFGERLPELAATAPAASQLRARQAAARVAVLRAGPGATEYAFSEPGERLYARIDVQRGRRPAAAAPSLTARGRSSTNATLARALVRYPLHADAGHGLIHWQALKLWLKRVPVPPQAPVRPGQGVGAAMSARARAARSGSFRAARAAPLERRRRARARAGRSACLHEGGARACGCRTASSGASAPAPAERMDDRGRRAACSAGSRRAARSGSASRTRRASGRADDLVGLLRAPAAATPRRRVERHPRLAPRPRARGRASNRRTRLRRARRQHRVPLRPRQRPLRAVPGRDDDLLLRDLRARRRAARRRPAAQAPAHLRQARARPGRPRARDRLRLGLASRCIAAGEYGAASPASPSRRAQAEMARRARAARPASTTASAILEQDYRDVEGTYTKHRVDRDARGDRREAVRDLLRRPATGCSRPAAAPASRRSSSPTQRYDRYRSTPRLDRALRLPRLPDSRRSAR